MRAQGSVEETSSARVSRRQYKAILTCDLVQEFFLPDFAVLERLAEYMMDNSGNLNLPNNAGSVLHVNRVATNHVTVGRCISHLRDAFAHRWRKPATRGFANGVQVTRVGSRSRGNLAASLLSRAAHMMTYAPPFPSPTSPTAGPRHLDELRPKGRARQAPA